mgnify:CR=1 FL=1
MSLLRPTERAAFLAMYLNLPEATGDPNARWEPFQFEHLNNEGLFGITTKSRQVGWSWLAAAESVAEAILMPRTPYVFVSISQDEATEKIRYAKQVIEALDAEVRPKLVIDNRMSIELANGSRLMSFPCRPLRGIARARVYLDEFAHYKYDREIYESAVPATTKGGRIRIGSSPLGATGLFWEIYTQTIRKYPGYYRGQVPWWMVAALCKDVREAAHAAPKLLTEQRVAEFGTQRIKQIYENVPIESFQQEYECDWVDESVSWITWEEIRRNQDPELVYWQANSVDKALAVIDEVAVAAKEGKIEAAFGGGADVGRKRNATEIALVGKSSSNKLPYRLGISLTNVEFDAQKAVLDKLLRVVPVTKFYIDRNGLGMQLAEQLEKTHRARAEGADFTNETKELWSVELKVRMQRGEVPIPLERELSYQIHSIKKMISAGKHSVFDTTGNEKHHADKYWGLALAVYAAKGGPKREVRVEWL